MSLKANLKYYWTRFRERHTIRWKDLRAATVRGARQTTARFYFHTVVQHLLTHRAEERVSATTQIEAMGDLAHVLVRQYSDLSGAGVRPDPTRRRLFGNGHAVVRMLETQKYEGLKILTTVVPMLSFAPELFARRLDSDRDNYVVLKHPTFYNYRNGDRMLVRTHHDGSWILPELRVLAGVNTEASAVIQRYCILRMLIHAVNTQMMSGRPYKTLHDLVRRYQQVFLDPDCYDQAFNTIELRELEDLLRCAFLLDALPVTIGYVAMAYGDTPSPLLVSDLENQLTYYVEREFWLCFERTSAPSSLRDFLNHPDRFDPIHHFNSRLQQAFGLTHQPGA